PVATAGRLDLRRRARPRAIGVGGRGHHRALMGWDAATYAVVSDPHVKWAEAVLERLPLRGGETVLDAGCGSGRVTELLVQRLPRGRVIAVDGDANMVAKARERLGARAEVEQQDAPGLRRDDPV